jgi:hypothetical protein
MHSINRRAEFIIKRYVLAHQPPSNSYLRFVIARSSDVLASGYFKYGDKDELAKCVKKASLHYPTPEEIEAQKREAEKKYLRERAQQVRKIKDLTLPRMILKTKGSKKKLQTEKPIVEVNYEYKYAELSTKELPKVQPS